MASTAPQGEIASIVIWIVGICLLVTTPFILLFIQFSLELTKTKKNETSGPEVLMFKDICYYINNSEKKKLALLKDISGIVKPGEICALMGQSGAGY